MINQASSNIIVRNSKFSNNVIQGQDDNECSGLKIRTTNANTSIAILDSSFVGNRHAKSSFTSSGLFVKVIGNPESHFSLIISRTAFLSNSLGANVFVQASSIALIVLSELVFSNNTHQGILIPTLDASHTSLTLSNTSFTNNGNGGIVCAILSENSDKKMVNIRLEHSNFTYNSASTAYSSAVYFHLDTNDNSVYNVSIEHCNFTNNNNGTIWIFTTESKLSMHLVIIKEVLVMGSQMIGNPTGGGAVSVILNGFMNNTIIINNVKFLSNNYMGVAGGALYIKTTNGNSRVYITNCRFQENTANGEGAALFIVDDNTGSSITMCRTYVYVLSNFTSNSGGNSVVYISAGSTFTTLWVYQSKFCNNIGTAIHSLSSTLRFEDNVIFSNNSANNGGALYLEGGTKFLFDNKFNNVGITFHNNSAAQYGGAIYVDLDSNCGDVFSTISSHYYFNSSFSKNSAGISGSSMYFNVHQHCIINPDYSKSNSILYFPYRFNYDESFSKALVSSPHLLVLYFTEQDGVQIGDNTYLAKHNILGHQNYFI